MLTMTSGKCFGGYARVATVVNSARKKDPSTLFLDAGDQLIGSPWVSVGPLKRQTVRPNPALAHSSMAMSVRVACLHMLPAHGAPDAHCAPLLSSSSRAKAPVGMG